MTPLWVRPPPATFVSFSITVSLRRKVTLLPMPITTWTISKLRLTTEQSSPHLWKNQRRGWEASTSDGESHEMGILGLKAAQGYWVEGRRQDKNRKQMLEGVTGDRAGLWGTRDWTSHHCASCPSTTNVYYVLTGCCGSYMTWVKTSQAGNHVIWTNEIIRISNSSQVFTFRGVCEEVHTCATLLNVPFCCRPFGTQRNMDKKGSRTVTVTQAQTITLAELCSLLFLRCFFYLKSTLISFRVLDGT